MMASSDGIHRKQQQKAARKNGYCRGFNDCVTMGSIVSTSQKHNHLDQRPHPSVSKLEQQVAELEKEVLQQKEARYLYRKRMERTQDYLKYCLQAAQDNGVLHLITGNKDEQQECLSVISIDGNTSPQSILLPTSAHHQRSELAFLVQQAKMNGWYIDPRELELQEKISRGSTAEIYRANWRGLDVAVKCINPDYFRANEGAVGYFAQEVDTLRRQRHRYVIQLMGACLEPPGHAWLVTELLSTTLKQWLHGTASRRKERTTPLPPLKERIARALEIAQAMQYLHEQKPKVVHRDLKPSNIFLDDSNRARVADFGHARLLGDEEKALTGETGTYVYMAPEVIRSEPYDEKCDVYNFGIILNELLTGDHPYIETDSSPTKIAMEVADGSLRPMLPEDNGQLGELIELTCLSWCQDASLRPSFARITSRLKNIQQRIEECDC